MTCPTGDAAERSAPAAPTDTPQTVPVPVELLRRVVKNLRHGGVFSRADAAEAVEALIPPLRKRPTEAAVDVVRDAVFDVGWSASNQEIASATLAALADAGLLHPDALEDTDLIYLAFFEDA